MVNHMIMTQGVCTMINYFYKQKPSKTIYIVNLLLALFLSQEAIGSHLQEQEPISQEAWHKAWES